MEEYDINPWPNQKVVFTRKTPYNNGERYATINYETMSKAIKTLCPKMRTSSPFVLWCYLAKNKPDIPFYLSHRAFAQYTNLSKDAYDYAVKTLIEKGYLVQKENHIYSFYETAKGKSGS